MPGDPAGIVLVFVLSLLSLFSVLVAGFVIFSGQAVTLTDLRQSDQLPADAMLDEVLSRVVRGSDDYHSAVYSHSLLEDLYGSDSLLLRVANNRTPGASTPAISGTNPDWRIVPLYATNRPVPTPTSEVFLVKIPTSLADYHNDGPSVPDGESLPILAGRPASAKFTDEELEVDDALAGRRITFMDGPLLNATTTIVRSFSNESGESVQTRGALVLDLRDFGDIKVEINGGALQKLNELTIQAIPWLFYDRGIDGQPGKSGSDDDGNGTADDATELGTPGSDDFGYRFVINGAPFDGGGSDPEGSDTLVRTARG